MKPSPFTEDEKKILASPPFDINKVIKIKTPEEIKKMWLQLDDSKKYNPKSKFRAGATFDKTDFEKRYGKMEEKPVSTPQISEQDGKAAVEQDKKQEDKKPIESQPPKDAVPKDKTKDIRTEENNDQDDLPF